MEIAGRPTARSISDRPGKVQYTVSWLSEDRPKGNIPLMMNSGGVFGPLTPYIVILLLRAQQLAQAASSDALIVPFGNGKRKRSLCYTYFAPLITCFFRGQGTVQAKAHDTDKTWAGASSAVSDVTSPRA